MAGRSEYNLGYFTGDDVIFEGNEKSTSFIPTDKNRFFQLTSQYSLTTVAISKVHLTFMEKNQPQYIDFNVLTRSKDGRHAEQGTVDKIRQIITKKLQNPGAKLNTLILVMNITYSPCNVCQTILQDFFLSLDCKITFVLRIAYLYHEKGVKGYDMPIEQLANWMIGLEGMGFSMIVESIEVTRELSSHSPRDKTGWEKVKERRQKEDEAMKLVVRQVYKRKGEIEEENRKRAEAAAISLGKMKI